MAYNWPRCPGWLLCQRQRTGEQTAFICQAPFGIGKLQKAFLQVGLSATSFVLDALALKDLPEVFDSVIDSGLFHILSDEARRRERSSQVE
jgi:hypothetical protein